MKISVTSRIEKPTFRRGKFSELHNAIINISNDDTLHVEFDTEEDTLAALGSVRSFNQKSGGKYEVWNEGTNLYVNVKSAPVA